jgi:DNA replication and repair protein RecF
VYLEHLSLTDFRSYAQVDLAFEPGVTVLVGYNGIGKTNLMEAIGYLATLSSHRVSSDGPLLRFGTDRALVRARLVRGGQTTVLELEINAGRANRGRINRSNPVRARDLLGICQTVLFAPEDLALVKGDPSNRRRFLDELLASLIPHHADTRSYYDRVLKQRTAPV